MMKKLMLRQHGCPRGSQIGSVTCSLVFLFWVTTCTVATAQTKPTNHWQLGGSVGYATSIQRDKDWIYKDVIVENDSVVGYVPGNFRYGTSSGFNIDAEFVYQKKSGWYNILGIQSFVSLPVKYYNGYKNPQPLELHSQWTERGGYAMLKFGVGYKTSFKRNANLFLGGNFMWGSGWYNVRYANRFTGESGEWANYTIFQSMFLACGISFEAGTLLKLTRNVEGVIKTGLNVSAFSVWENSHEGLKNNPYYDTGSLVWDFYNINFSLGIRYNL
jgi:hypothetical protein